MLDRIKSFKEKNKDVIDGLKTKIYRERIIIPTKEEIAKNKFKEYT